MSRENVELLERTLAISQDDPTAFLAILDDEVCWEVDALDVPDAGNAWYGAEGVREFFRRWVTPFDDWGWEFGDLVDVGVTVIVHIRQWGRGRGSGVPVENAFWQAWTFREGKVIRTTHHQTKKEALEAAGLSE